MQANQADVAFDYEGALSLARRLYALAEEVELATRSRQALCDDAKRDFSGRYAEEFARRMSMEGANGAGIAQSLRMDAENCARAWKWAMEEENNHLYARHVDAIKAKRTALQTVWEGLFGFEYPPPPEAVPLPRPPLFAPTAGLVIYR